MPDPVPLASEPAGATPARATLYAGFLLTGVVTVLLGPLLPELSREWSVPVDELAPLFVAQFLASAVGSLLSSYRQGLSLAFGYLLIGGGLLSLAIAGWPLALAAAAATGLGLGLAIPATNLRVAHSQPRRRGAALSSLNLAWGAGAVACPLLFAMRPRGASSDAVLVALAAAAAIVLLLLGRGRRFRRPPLAAADPLAANIGEERGRASGGARDRTNIAEGSGPERPSEPPGARTALAAIAAILFLYVGIENAVGGWLVSLADQFQPGRAATSLWIGSGFWAALLASRAVAPLLLRRISEPALYGAGLALAGAGLFGLLVGRSQAAVAAAAVAVGAGLAPLFPLTVSFLAELTAATRSRSTGWVFALAGAGGAALPWLTARIAGGVDRLAAGFVAPMASLALLALLFGLLRRLGGAAPPRPV